MAQANTGPSAKRPEQGLALGRVEAVRGAQAKPDLRAELPPAAENARDPGPAAGDADLHSCSLPEADAPFLPQKRRITTRNKSPSQFSPALATKQARSPRHS